MKVWTVLLKPMKLSLPLLLTQFLPGFQDTVTSCLTRGPGGAENSPWKPLIHTHPRPSETITGGAAAVSIL